MVSHWYDFNILSKFGGFKDVLILLALHPSNLKIGYPEIHWLIVTESGQTNWNLPCRLPHDRSAGLITKSFLSQPSIFCGPSAIGSESQMVWYSAAWFLQPSPWMFYLFLDYKMYKPPSLSESWQTFSGSTSKSHAEFPQRRDMWRLHSRGHPNLRPGAKCRVDLDHPTDRWVSYGAPDKTNKPWKTP